MVKNQQNIPWSKEKTFELIAKYEKNDCLWNCHTDNYKCRDKRDAAITSICNSMKITRDQFSRKIHNLRNQFNYESKKLSKNSNNVNDDGSCDSFVYHSKWEYFNALTFLKKVIAPRPGFSVPVVTKQFLTHYEVKEISNEESEDISAVEVEIEDDEDDVLSISSVKSYPEETAPVPQPPPSTTKKNFNKISSLRSSDAAAKQSNPFTTIIYNDKKFHDNQQISVEDNNCMTLTIKGQEEQLIPSTTGGELLQQQQAHNYESHILDIESAESTLPPKKKPKTNPNLTMAKTTNNNNNNTTNDNNFNINKNIRNNEGKECDIFGEFVAEELKSLTHFISRKKLKRKIMEAILIVANEDEQM